MSQYAALHGPRRRVLEVKYISLADALRQKYTGPRFVLVLECGHEVRRELVRRADSVKCGECLGPEYNAKGFLRSES